MLEIILGIVIFAGGIFAGTQAEPEQKELMQCSLACGEGRLQEYNGHWKKCQCVKER